MKKAKVRPFIFKESFSSIILKTCDHYLLKMITFLELKL